MYKYEQIKINKVSMETWSEGRRRVAWRKRRNEISSFVVPCGYVNFWFNRHLTTLLKTPQYLFKNQDGVCDSYTWCVFCVYQLNTQRSSSLDVFIWMQFKQNNPPPTHPHNSFQMCIHKQLTENNISGQLN